MASVDDLIRFVARHPRLLVITGAGCSTDSGIPDYRDTNGDWKRAQPVTYQAFTGSLRTRQRYWARSIVGFRKLRGVQPNDAHRALAALEARGFCRASGARLCLVVREGSESDLATGGLCPMVGAVGIEPTTPPV